MKVKLSIGDWSQDGHNQYDELVFESSHPVEAIQQAYKDSCRKLGLTFDCNSSHTDIPNLNWQHPEYKDRQVCVEYEQYSISDFALKIFKEHGINVAKNPGVEGFAKLMIDIFKLSLPELVLEEASFKRSELKDIPAINGWWCKLNESWGYGLYE